ncbi:DUF4245 domain-containing protein [Lysobacter korlensis]|uniref:DUF4245 domain-containing protein n=1 Tax=Lysobacter korlensis TaxID=553636 RepID=A0ABV6RZB0_9GAMM
MAKPAKPPVVAELGRPETPEEASIRRDEARRNRRARQTTFNLVIATLASLVLAAFFGILMSNPGSPGIDAVDYRAAAADAQGDVEEPLVAPELPEGWQANRAEFEKAADGVAVWRLGLLTAAGEFIGVKQGIDANPTWLAAQVADTSETGSASIGGLDWTLREGDPEGNLARAMTAEHQGSTVVLYGTADDDEFTALADAVGGELTE